MTSTQEKNEPFSITAAARDLVEKYREMLALRAHDADGTLDDPRPRMRALAARFPGSLREIDELPIDVLRARLAHVEAASAGHEAEPWVVATWLYHRALVTRLSSPTTRAAPRPSAQALSDVASALSLDVDAVHRLLHPHGRRRR